MRPVERGPSPQTGDFTNYRDAFESLAIRLGLYCSYCERYIPAGFAVEHIQPKGLKLPDGTEPYRNLEGRWTNFLIACVNCNSTKGDRDVDLTTLLLPDRDNTFVAFTYAPDGKVAPSPEAPPGAAELIRLTGLGQDVRQIYDDNGQLVALDRSSQRMEAWAIAEQAKSRWSSKPTSELRDTIIDLARNTGFFSIWMKVFEADPPLRKEFIRAFKAASACFDLQTTSAISPRPTSGLAHGGKI